jgi:mRNA interferase YafQ
MRRVKFTNRFKRDYRREKSGQHGKRPDAMLMEVVNQLAVDMPLPRRNFDHVLTGEWSDNRDCHIRPDLLLIYRKPETSLGCWQPFSAREKASALVLFLKARLLRWGRPRRLDKRT